MRVDKRGAVTALGAALTLTAIMAAPVFAETPSAVTTDDKKYLNTEGWSDLAAANVQTYANIRQGADTSTTQVGVLLPGYEVQVLSNDGTWSKVKSGNVEGYIRNDLLVFGEEARVHYKNVCGFSGTVTAQSLNVREGSSEESSILTVAPEKSSLELEGLDGDWYLVEYEGETGYVDAGYVQVDAPDCVALTVEEYQNKLATEAQSAVSSQESESQAAGQSPEPQNQDQTADSDEADSDEADSDAAVPASASVSSSDLDLLAAIIQCEAGGESRTGKVAVGAVIMNRVNSGSFPNSISEVVYQGGQFSPVSNGALSSVQASGARSDCYEAAQAALAGENPVGGCLYFNSGSGRGTQIGNQHFY